MNLCISGINEFSILMLVVDQSGHLQGPNPDLNALMSVFWKCNQINVITIQSME